MISSFLVLSLAFGGGGKAGEGAVPGPVPGWERTSYAAHHTPSDLHKYMNGGAAKYLAYSIQELHVQEYSRRTDKFAAVLELYRMDSAHNAYGVYSSDRSGPHPEGNWQEGTYEAGLLQFWSGRYYVRVQAIDPSGNPEEEILELGRAVGEALGSWDPAGVEASPSIPALAAGMPVEGMVEDSLCFFHNQVSLNSIYYLSNKNLLKLNLNTDAVSALYGLEGERSTRVIAVCYSDSAAAAAAHVSFWEAYVETHAAEEQGHVETDNQAPQKGVFSTIRDNLLVIVLDAPTYSAAEELGGRVAAAAKCDEEEKK